MACWRLLLCCAAAYAADLTKEDILLARVRHHMGQMLSRLPNYTCTQTIERLEKRAPSKRIQLLDVLRLEVALVNGRELYKWPGSGEFRDGDLRDMITGGATGTGQFAGFAQNVFLGGTARYTYAGEEMKDNLRLVRWNYVVPQNLSRFSLRVGDQEAIVGFHGSFWIDRDTLDAKRLEVHADEIPPQLRLTSTATAVEYARSQIGTGEFLLPSMSEMEMVDLQGGSSVNRARFAGCRQYTGESTITFDEPVNIQSSNSEPRRVVDAPAGMSLDLALETPIREETTAIGDPITMMLKKDVKQGGSVIAPKGAIGHGRVSFLRRQTIGRYTGYIVGLELLALEFENTRLRISADLEQISSAGIPSPAEQLFRQGAAASAETGQPIPPAAFFKQGYSLFIDKGTRMYWRTKAPVPEDKK
jgi:hypothetical protein